MKKISKITIILMTLSFAFLANNCEREDENHHKTIEVINNSDKAVYTYLSTSYPDTLDMYGVPSSPYPSIYKIEPYERNKSALSLREFYEVIFRDGGQIPSDTLMVFFMDAEKLESETTHVHNSIIQRYDLSLQDLQQVNWMLTYPPSSEMKNIKMYPPYQGK